MLVANFLYGPRCLPVPPLVILLRRWLLLMLGLLIVGCRPDEGRTEVHERVVMQNDFEALPDSLRSLLSERQARSGRYAVSIDSAHEFSYSFKATLGQLFAVRPRKLRLKAWVWVPRYEDNAALVVAISAPDNPSRLVYYQPFFLADKGPYKDWKHITQDIDLPEEIGFNSQLGMYLWRVSAQQAVYLDDWSLAEIR